MPGQLNRTSISRSPLGGGHDRGCVEIAPQRAPHVLPQEADRVAHDLRVVRYLSDEVAVMYLGTIVEVGDRDEIYERPSHPYTQALLSAVPLPDPQHEQERKRIKLEGDPPSPLNPPSGCHFRTRCWKATERCAAEEPALVDRGQGHPSACHYAEVEEAVL